MQLLLARCPESLELANLAARILAADIPIVSNQVQFSLLDNEKLSAELVSQYLSVKRRQLI